MSLIFPDLDNKKLDYIIKCLKLFDEKTRMNKSKLSLAYNTIENRLFTND